MYMYICIYIYTVGSPCKVKDGYIQLPCVFSVILFTVASWSDPHDSEPDGDDRHCECDFRRRSWDDVIDEEGKALLSILEFPSKVC